MDLLLLSENYFQKSMGVYVLSDLFYKICEVHIDIIMGSDDNFITNVRYMVVQVKELMIGKDKVPFVGHEIDSSGINMSQNLSKGK